jgi:ribosome-binding protein aMBF1 (putative translation factor)
MDHQNWNTTVLRKDKPKSKQANFTKPRGDVTQDDEKPFKKIGHDFKLALCKARTTKGLTQKELALKVNVTPTVIQSYESGKVIPNGELINKFNRILGVKLPKCK